MKQPHNLSKLSDPFWQAKLAFFWQIFARDKSLEKISAVQCTLTSTRKYFIKNNTLKAIRIARFSFWQFCWVHWIHQKLPYLAEPEFFSYIVLWFLFSYWVVCSTSRDYIKNALTIVSFLGIFVKINAQAWHNLQLKCYKIEFQTCIWRSWTPDCHGLWVSTSSTHKVMLVVTGMVLPFLVFWRNTVLNA